MSTKIGTEVDVLDLELDAPALKELGRRVALSNDLEESQGFNPYDTGAFRALAFQQKVAKLRSGQSPKDKM